MNFSSKIQCIIIVIGELSCGSISNRIEILVLLKDIPRVEPALEDEVFTLIDNINFYGIGLGFMVCSLSPAMMNEVGLNR